MKILLYRANFSSEHAFFGVVWEIEKGGWFRVLRGFFFLAKLQKLLWQI